MKQTRSMTAGAVAALLVFVAGAAWAQDAPEGYKPERTKVTQPEYPRKAYEDEVEGYVDLELTIGPEGRVEDVAILNAEPRQVFERAAIRAALDWEYRPPSEDGINGPVKDKIRLSFRIDRE